MNLEIEYSPDALAHLGALRKFDQVRIVSEIEEQLRHEPLMPSRRRKQMQSNLISTWELRIGDFHAYYDVDDVQPVVLIRAIGLKVRDRVFVGGEEVDLSDEDHRNH